MSAPGPSPKRLVLAYDGLAIGVTTWRPTDAEWLCEVMSPAFELRADASADVEVSLRVDRERFSRLRERGPAASGACVGGAILDASTERFALWSDGVEAGARTAFDPQFRVFHEVGPGARVRLTAEAGELCRVALMRVVREYATEACLRGGSALLHAAALCVGGRAVVIAGPKESGKTTTLSWCLQGLADARFIANDRVRLRAVSRGWEARAMPTLMSFRPEGLALLPELDAKVRAQRGMPYHSRREARDRTDLGRLAPYFDGRLGLAPSRFAQLIGRAATPVAPAAAIVFPSRCDGDTGLRADRIDAAEAAGRLDDVLFGASAQPGRRSELFGFPDAGPFPSVAELRERASRVAGSVPAFVWRVGSAAHRDRAALQRFAAGLDRY